MNDQQHVTLKGTSKPHLFLVASHLVMIVISAYLLNYYFSVHYPKDLVISSLCQISSFFTCDTATFSPISNIFGIPLALFGLVLGSLFLVSSLFPHPKFESTNRILSISNAIGCLLLALYSFFVLHSFCPGCSIYWLSSFVSAFIFFKYSSFQKPSCSILSIYGVVIAIAVVGTFLVIQSKEKDIAEAAPLIMANFISADEVGHPNPSSPYRLASATEDFKAAPLRLTIFSDFECPACGELAKLVPLIKSRYRGKINIEYFFFPLDQDCNSAIDRKFHENSCKASYLVSCLGEKFEEGHDELFANGTKLSSSLIQDFAKKYGALECMNLPETKSKVVAMVNQGIGFAISSTPTMILNGIKIEGYYPPAQLFVIMDGLLKKHATH